MLHTSYKLFVQQHREEAAPRHVEYVINDSTPGNAGRICPCVHSGCFTAVFRSFRCCVKFSGNLLHVIPSGLCVLTMTDGYCDLDVFLAVGGKDLITTWAAQWFPSYWLHTHTHVKTRHLCVMKRKKQDKKRNGSEALTFTQRDKGDVVGKNALGNRWTGSDAGVVATVRRVHLGDIEVSRYLGDKASFVQRDEGGEFVEDPAEGQLGWGQRKKETWQNANQATEPWGRWQCEDGSLHNLNTHR